MYHKYIKRFFDIILSLCCIIVSSPILLVTALLVRIKLGSPVIFKQERPGYHNEIFTLYKFRSMTDAVDENGDLLPDKERLPRFGQMLRSTSLDELPEFFNILFGHMSFVGPRRDVPGYADQLVGDDREVLKLRPGITGPASLKYRDEEDLLALQPDPQKYNDEVIFPDKVRINLYYLQHYSFVKDIEMIFCTVLGRKMKYNNEII